MSKRHANQVGNADSLFIRLEELVRANSGVDDFEEVFTLLIAKLWDERSGRPARFIAHRSGAETARAIGTLLGEAAAAWPEVLEPNTRSLLTDEHLRVCVEALARHTLADVTLSALDSFFEFLVARHAKGAKGQFFTPRHVVEFCVRMLRPGAAETVLDPACGSGGFLLHALEYVRREEALSPAAVRSYSAARLWGFDLDPRALRVAATLLEVAANARANLARLNSLLRPQRNGEVNAGGPMREGFDLILTNPPFAGEVREAHILDAYEVSRGKRRVERDVLFLERCVELLRPGGRLAIVLPHNKLATAAWGPVRHWLLRQVHVLAVVGLGRNTFLPHTHQKAGVLFAQKRSAKDAAALDRPIFFAVSEQDGKDTRGQRVIRPGSHTASPPWERIDHDLDEVVHKYHEFRRALGAEV